jgi:hypothetical protein
MIKIFITVRNRLAITKKCIEALKKNSDLSHQIYVYNNATSYRVGDHFKYFALLYARGEITQVCFTTEKSTFNAFSKASTCNFFGQQHEQDPKKESYDYLVMMDNDIIVLPHWDTKLRDAWRYVHRHKLKHIKVIGQRPGGIKYIDKSITHNIRGDLNARVGKLGGSGLWSVRTNFFKDVGFLKLATLVGQDKKHDQMYWRLMEKSSNGKPYIMGLQTKLGIHAGAIAGSVCNKLTRNRGIKNKSELIKFEQAEKNIEAMDFEQFMTYIKKRRLASGW